MTLQEILAQHGSCIMRHANKLKIPIHRLDINENGARQFNVIYDELLCSDFSSIIRTKSGGISIEKRNFKPPMWDVQYSRACIELTVIAYGKMLRIQFRQTTSIDANNAGEERQIYGRQAFSAWKKECEKDGIDFDSYAIENGQEIKKSIPKYMIRVASDYYCGEDKIYENCHHIDFHNSFPAGLVNTHPEFSPTITRLYEKRKEKPVNKAILNYTIGFMQSMDQCGARWAHLAKDAIADNNKRLFSLSQKISDSGCRLLLWNTDGIWYQGDIYHGEGEGPKLGQWENDHTNCTLRIKSKGAYEFIEDGKYYPVLRGYTKLDKVKPRAQWEWGDIFHTDAAVVNFYWVDGEGITDHNYHKII